MIGEAASNSQDVFLFVGPPGSGKGTLAQECVKQLGWKQLSTGNLCRQHIADQTDVGKQIDFAIKSGKLVSDSLIVAMVYDWFLRFFSSGSTIVFDGFPRTVSQAREFAVLLEDNFENVSLKVVRLEVSDEAILGRLCSRFVCGNRECQAVYSLAPDSQLVPQNSDTCDFCEASLVRRADDEESAVRERLVGYCDHERTLLEFYKMKRFDIVRLSAERSPQEVFGGFRRLMEFVA